MGYPFWDVGIGYGVLMAGIAILHVFVSHFAIGGGLYLVVTETAARRAGNTQKLEFLRGLTKFFVLVTLVFGALTGVGIWFVIGLLNPTATEALIHHFVWGWATEWTFFVVEICAALVYFYGWKRMASRDHLIVGWIYFAAAWLSLFIINGIICFMLTPGRWLVTGGFWDGFFNPTFWPSLVLRTGICIMLAGLYAMLVASRQKDDEFRRGLVRGNAVWAIVGVAVIIPGWYWYWHAIPAAVTTEAVAAMPTPITALEIAAWFLAAIALLVVVFGVFLPKRVQTAVAIVLLACGLGFFGGFEWMRESIRKPFVIYGYMYGNAVELDRTDTYKRQGYLPDIAFRTGDDGADLFRHACRSCHTVHGYNPLASTFDGTDPEFVKSMILGVGAIRGNMPPFLGTEQEAALIAEHIWSLVDQRPFNEIHRESGVALGEKVFAVRCGRCHVFGGYQDNRSSIAGLEKDEYDDIFDNGSDFADEMPNFTGDDAERAALITYLQSLGEGGEAR
jgi:mono/diheme cytochrome c family protein